MSISRFRQSMGAMAFATLLLTSVQVIADVSRLSEMESENGLFIDGPAIRLLMGKSAVATGDFNNDGLADLVIGAPNAVVRRSGATLNLAGEVYILFGGKGGIASGFDINSLRASNGGDGSLGVVIQAEAPGNALGQSLSNAGDVNGDGFDDLLVGGPRVSQPGFGGFGFGASYIIFGHATGSAWPAEIDLRSFRVNPEADAVLGVVLDGSQAGGFAGASVAGLGDVTGDGVNDILVGSGRAINASRTRGRGFNYLVYGRTAGNPWPAVYKMIELQPNIGDGSEGIVILSNRTEDGLGMQVAAVGDFSGDGIDDMLLGAANSGQLAEDAGMALLVPGRVSGVGEGFDNNLDLRNDGKQELVHILAGAVGGDLAGSTVAGIGDINADGRPDIAIGAPFAQSQGPDAGVVYVIFGRPENSPLPEVFSLNRLLPENGADGKLGFVLKGIDGDRLGTSLAGLGDINGDGITDLLVGASDKLVDGAAPGGAYVLHGRGADNPFPAMVDMRQLADGNGQRGFVLTGERNFDRAGIFVAAAGDLNSDGSSDYLIGADLYDGVNLKSGRVYLVFGEGNDINAGPTVDGRMTHAWYDPARAGEGIVTEFGLRDGEPSFFAAWYTYLDGEQQWFATGVPEYSQDGLVIDTSLILTSGGLFGDAFDPALVENTAWGSLHIEISDCDALSWRYQSTDGSQSGTRNFIPALPDLLGLSGCREASKNNKGLVFGSGLGAELSGTWWNPARAGEGIIVDIEDRGGQPTAFLSWFTYDQGVQQWLVGSTDGIDLSSNSLTDLPLVITSGGQFGAAFDPAQVVNTNWGTVTLEFTSCTTAILNFDGQFPGGNTVMGQVELVRFTEGLQDFPCTD